MSKARDLANAGTALTTVSATELGYLDGVTSAVQTQVDGKEATLPSQTGNSGKYLTTNGTAKSWGTVSQYALPTQTGNSGKYLTTNGTAESWGTVTTGGMTLLSTTTLSGASTTISSIDQSYVNLVVFVFGVTNATDNGRFKCLPNNVSNITTQVINDGDTNMITMYNQFIWLTSPSYNALRTNANNFRTMTISNYASTTARKGLSINGGYFHSGDNTSRPHLVSGYIETNSAITSLVFSVTDTGGNMSTGTVLVYGVK
jgi:hypothetical protein